MTTSSRKYNMFCFGVSFVNDCVAYTNRTVVSDLNAMMRCTPLYMVWDIPFRDRNYEGSGHYLLSCPLHPGMSIVLVELAVLSNATYMPDS